MSRMLSGLAVSAASLLLMTACGSGGGGAATVDDDYPSGKIEFVTAGDPGGGLDLFAREIKQVLDQEKLTDASLSITNQGGGGGNTAMAVGRQRKGDIDTLIGNSNRIYLNPIMGTTDLAVGKDFVPIAQLMTEYVVLAVRADSKFKSAQDLVDALKKDPRSVNLGVGTVPSDDQLHLLRLGKAIGIEPADLNIVAFSAGGDLMTQLLGGQVDVVSTGLSEALPQHKAGEVRILAVSAPERMSGPAGDIPTWKDMGIDLVVEHWRGVFGPADMPAEAIKMWDAVFAKMVKSDSWTEVLEKNQWSPIYRDSSEFADVIEKEASTAEELLHDVGLVK